MNDQTSVGQRTKPLVMSTTGSVTLKFDRTKNLGVVFTWTANNAPNGTISLNAGNDPSRLTSYSGVTIPTQPAGSAGNCGIEIVDFAFNYLQVVYTRGSGGTGDTLTIDTSAKG